MDEWLKWWPVALFALNLVILAGGWAMRKEFATKDEVSALKGSVSLIDTRLQIVENDMEHVPSKEEIGRLSENVAFIKGAFERWGRSIDRIEDFLLNKSA